jgi:tRNA threonylcarbamoyladenosine biosynthesis protein TsaB
VAVLRDDTVVQMTVHDSVEDYSSWLLPAVERVLNGAGLEMRDVGGYAVAAGPGSFTGVRVGLTTVKAWAEVYGKPIAAVSRLETVARQAPEGAGLVAAFVDAQRGQVFGGIYRRNGGELEPVGEEMVIGPGRFVETTAALTVEGSIAWVSTDPACIVGEEAWKTRERRGEKVELVSSVLAPMIGRIGSVKLAEGRFTDALALDANYVRRSDAEIFWKGAAHGR